MEELLLPWLATLLWLLPSASLTMHGSHPMPAAGQTPPPSPVQEEFKYYQEDAGSTLVVVGASGNKGAEAAGVAPAIGVTLDFASGAPVLHLASRVGEFALKTAPAGEALADPPRGDDVALFLHTSGTTSRPKGVPLTHTNLTASLENIRQVGS